VLATCLRLLSAVFLSDQRWGNKWSCCCSKEKLHACSVNEEIYWCLSLEFWEKLHACSVNEEIYKCFSLEFWEKPHACSINAREIYAHFSQTTWEKWDSCSDMSGLFSWYWTVSLDFPHLLNVVVLKILVTMDYPSSAVYKSTCWNPPSRLAIILLLLLSGNVQSDPGPDILSNEVVRAAWSFCMWM
jgi:hypothetical protein